MKVKSKNTGSRLTPCRDDTRDGTGAVPYNTYRLRLIAQVTA